MKTNDQQLQENEQDETNDQQLQEIEQDEASVISNDSELKVSIIMIHNVHECM